MELRLRELMKSKSLSSIALAENVGVSRVTVSYWLNGKAMPSLDAVDKIAKALDVPFWQLFVSPQEVTGCQPAAPTIICPRCGTPIALHPTIKED